jgi:hypothetical protein
MPLSRKQQGNYRKLVDAAYAAEAERLRGELPVKEDWRRKLNMDLTEDKYSTKQMNNADFDRVMLELAIMAGDDYWIGRCSTNDSRKLRHVIEWFVRDLEVLEKHPIDWSYIVGICDQAKYASGLMDCPDEHLVKIMQMVDTHVRRLARRADIERADLPSAYFRKGCSDDEAIARFHHDHHHHINHGRAA